ncbi:MAG: MoxR family ATPase, partial [Defluviitaleaceae bacterium]|nr:MoxR family ATPase [Defluviitaleaceae bacterium]
RTQPGLLESMEERQITVDQTTYPLGEPYFVIATQNPVETHGTFPLPEAQLDRFMMQLGIGYPSSDETAQIICERAARDPLPEIAPVCGRDEIIEIQSKARGVFIHAEVARYITSLAESTRSNDSVALGISTRGAIALARASQAYAAISGRVFVIPDDVKRLLPYVFAHRLILRGGAGDRLTRAKRVVADAIETTPVPVEDFGKAARVG